MPDSSNLLAQPLTLPCGATLPNRLAKAAMTEGLSDRKLRANERHQRLYRTWSQGGCGMLLTGNVQIDKRVLERPGNVAIDGNGGRAALEAWARAGTENGNHLWMQISHAGRQSPRYVTREPMGPSAVQLKLLGNFAKPRALAESEILDFIGRYANVAAIAKQTGFTGVQIHGAHGYLLSSFLSPVTNQRNDRWGGSLENRARMLLEVIRDTRAAVGPDFPVTLKLNSADFQKGGFTHEECLQVVEWLNEEGLGLLEVSGGNYEQPRLLGYEGKEDGVVERESTRKREAYFSEYAAAIRKVAKMPIMQTGGFRTRAAMLQALEQGDCDVVGLGRPLCTHPNIANDLISGAEDEAPSFEHTLHMGKGQLSANSSNYLIKVAHVFGQQGWYYKQIARLGDGLAPDTGMGVGRALGWYLKDEYLTAARMQR